MQITDGKLYLNRTWKYIYPALRVYGFQPINYLNELIKQGVGIYDFNFDEEEQTPKIFILIQTKVLNVKKINRLEYDKKIIKFFEYIRLQKYYVDDYIYNIDKSCCSHMLVLEFPLSFKPIFKAFKEGKYSKMYTEEQIKKYFPNSTLNTLLKNPNSLTKFNISKTLGQNLEIHGVLLQSEDYKEEFINLVKKDFEVSLSKSDVVELDYPPVLEEEVYNYTKVNIKV